MTDETHRFTGNAAIQTLVATFMSKKTLRIMYDKYYDIKNSIQQDDLQIDEYLVHSDFDDYDIPVSVYMPKINSMAPSDPPICILMHGGAFQFGSRRSHHATVLYLAHATQTIWVSIEYRLSPEFKYPTGLRDCLSVTRWVLDNKQGVFVSTTKVGVYGDSSGGCLAALVANQFRSKLAFQILVYPWLDLTCSSAKYDEFTGPAYINRQLAKRYVADYLGKEQIKNATDPLVSPIFQKDFRNLPRTLIITAELDGMEAEGREYFHKLHDANVPSTIHSVRGVLHGFFQNHNMKVNGFTGAAVHLIDFFQHF